MFAMDLINKVYDQEVGLEAESGVDILADGAEFGVSQTDACLL